MKYALLYNPIAGRGQAIHISELAHAYLESQGHEVHDGRSQRAGHIGEMAVQLADSVDRIVVMGGDGSLREAAQALLDAHGVGTPPTVELGIVPMGSGNVVARELGMPLDPERAIVAIEAGHAVTWDAGRVRVDETEGHGHVFLAMLGVGYDARIAASIDRARKSRLGGAVYRRSGDVLYAATGLRETFRMFPGRFSVQCDDRPPLERVVASVFCNTRTYGKGMVFADRTRPDDGLLDVLLRTSAAPWSSLATMVSAQLKRPVPRWSASLERTRRATVRAERGAGLYWQVDGDAQSVASHLDVEIEPATITLIGSPVSA